MKTEDCHEASSSLSTARQRRLGQGAIKRLIALHWVREDGAAKLDEADTGASTLLPRTQQRGPVPAPVEPSRAAQGLPALR